MTALRTLGAALVACSLLLAALGTGGFSGGTADRSVAVSVADDPTAYLGVDPEACRLTNHFAEPVTVTLSGEVRSQRLEYDSDRPESVELDDGGEQTLRLAPGEAGDVEVGGTTTVTAEGPNVAVETERRFDCATVEVVLEGDDVELAVDGTDGSLELPERVTENETATGGEPTPTATADAS